MAAKDFSSQDLKEIIAISDSQTKILQGVIRDKVNEVLIMHAKTIRKTDTHAQMTAALNTFSQLCAAVSRDMIEQWVFYVCMSLGEEGVLNGDTEKPLTGDSILYAVQDQIDRTLTSAIEVGRVRALKLTSTGLDMGDVIAMLRGEE